MDKLKKDESGAISIAFALILPLALLCILSAVDIGLKMLDRQMMLMALTELGTYAKTRCQYQVESLDILQSYWMEHYSGKFKAFTMLVEVEVINYGQATGYHIDTQWESPAIILPMNAMSYSFSVWRANTESCY